MKRPLRNQRSLNQVPTKICVYTYMYIYMYVYVPTRSGPNQYDMLARRATSFSHIHPSPELLRRNEPCCDYCDSPGPSNHQQWPRGARHLTSPLCTHCSPNRKGKATIAMSPMGATTLIRAKHTALSQTLSGRHAMPQHSASGHN